MTDIRRRRRRSGDAKIVQVGYSGLISAHSEADAKKRLPELIDRVLRGESVIITRRGKPAVELRPIAKQPRKISAAALDWLAEQRVSAKRPRENAGALLRRMRDEYER